MGSFAPLSVENGIATVALDANDDKLNILGPEQLAELDTLADQIAGNAEIVGVILPATNRAVLSQEPTSI